ncbi:MULTISPECIES: Abi family protein [Pantoea]|uniref:Abi family protein n=1 Tax=Pantoea TaxID=53335 RepID=UPI001654897C|nr:MULTISPECIES: Abi family protein [Pantoea]
MATLIPYQKPYLTSQALCQKLIADGLLIGDMGQASQTLERCSYYRFKAYLIPLKTPQGGYQHGASFENAVRLYNFDEELRALLFSFIQQAEIALRSSFDNWMTNECGQNAFWYLDATLFDDREKHTRTVTSIASSFRRSKEPFAAHFHGKYYNAFCSFYRDLPLGWVAMELLTFGQFKSLLEAIDEKAATAARLKRYASNVTGAKDFKTLKSWLTVLHQVRNICCHHSRLFNSNLPSPANFKYFLDPAIPLVRAGNSQKEQTNRLYTALVVLQQLMISHGYPNIGPRIKTLIVSYPEVLPHLPSMGFPVNWSNESHFGFL